MPISRFSFHNQLRGWRLNEVSFEDFNLLVGLSGAGKTRILQSLSTVREAALEGVANIDSCGWTLEVLVQDDRYRWSAEVHPSGEKSHFVSETIIKNDNQTLIHRDKQSFIFNQEGLPKLKNTESAITLLRDESLLAPLHQALSSFLFGGELAVPAMFNEIVLFDFGRIILGPLPNLLEKADKLRTEATSLQVLRQSPDVFLLQKAFVLQESFADEFERIKEDYREIFPTVSDFKVGLVEELAPTLAKRFSHLADNLVLGIKEEGVRGWIIGKHISAGMARTLAHLLEINLAPPGTVIVVDEFENSLGVNCLPQLTDHFLRRTDLQFILTSHHPYVINNIPLRYWKLVTRKGSEVTVKDAADIPALDTQSMLSRFVLLTNLDEYQEAIR